MNKKGSLKMTMLERLSWNPLNLLLLLKHSWCFKRYLTHSFPMHPFSTAWKHPKTGEVGKGCIGNEWVKIKLVARKASVAHLPSRVQLHCVKSVQIRSFFWSIFSRSRAEYVDLLRRSPYSARVRENTAPKKLRIWANNNP